ncbi:glycosyltransferase family 2 protein [Cellulomonas chengniuliangii]|uniref:Glycosyltransferase n=1 Tax=Cellulomonas chengniuliangii TaxID=2968084 RepID=A0ABY5KXD6_9CELL|nr:cellulose synthase catalytic subunit [Cellulomonas chengniuliangii]MCC2309354.1 glycosyltransferase [Cellulomonas chengniuliangii]MCC2316624.1 glycosyltransferase [Cellulomonas chengniuliangii]UUI75079.1 glycosyltransferase [Cellulomonas chengniuliangii]
MAATTFDRLLTEPRATDVPQSRPVRTPENEAAHSPSFMLLVAMACAGVILYAYFLLNPANRGDWLPWSMVMLAEAVLVTHALLSLWTMLSSGHNPRGFAFHHAQDSLYDTARILRTGAESTPNQWTMHLNGRPVGIDVFITTYGEDLATIRRTVTAALAMHGEHITWVLDDGRSDEVRDLAAELGARYVRRLSKNGAKAGNVNHALTITRGEFFVIFDADFVPEPEFLHETVPFFATADVAFVQTPQTYGNLHNLISRGAGYMQAVFYRYIQPGRNKFNSAFCVGTNVIFRRTAILDVGGMYSDSKSEDVWTSLRLHEAGWRSIYIPMALAVGDTPETIEAYTKQQLRWATGGFEIMFTHNPLSKKRNLNLDQRLQYWVTSTHYLTGIAPLLLLLVPPLQVYFGLTPMQLHMSPLTWALAYAGFYVMQIVVAFYTLGSFRWETLMLATVSFPIYVRALVNAFFRREQQWHVTGSLGRAASPFNFMMPQVLFFVFLLLTSVVGAWKDFGNGSLSLALAWNVTNTLILGAFVVTAAREQRQSRRDAVLTSGGAA